MSIERKRVILGGLVLMLGMGGSAWSPAPAAQQQPAAPASSQTTAPPSDVPPPLKRAGRHEKKKTPNTAPSDVPPPLKKPVVAKKKVTPSNSAPTPVAASAQAPVIEQKATQPASVPSPVAASLDSQTAAQPAPQTAAAPPALAKPVAQKKKGKQPYTGPNTIIEQPATPMLDADGKQRLDPDGQPMFNPPVKQQRDKSGHPLFDDHGKPVFQTATVLGYDDKGKRIRGKKEKAIKTTSIAIAEGTLTVDGMIGKATLNYDIKDFKYIYLYAPWIGTVVVSNRPFPGSKEQAKAFDQHTLTVTVEDHQFQLYSEKILLGRKPEPGYVAVDREFKLESKFPAMGYGTTLQTPYNWPGAKGNPESKAFVKSRHRFPGGTAPDEIAAGLPGGYGSDGAAGRWNGGAVLRRGRGDQGDGCACGECCSGGGGCSASSEGLKPSGNSGRTEEV